MAAAGTLAAGTGVLAAALFAPTAASASSSQTWTAGGDGSSWSDAMNWASHSVPQNGDSVTIPAVRFPARTVVNGMPAGTQLQDLTMTDASLSGGDVTVAGNFAWTGGTISGNLDVASTITTKISGTTTKELTSPTSTPTALILRGVTSLAGSGELELSGTTTLSNLGTMTLNSGTTVGASVCCVSPDTFSNGGTLIVAAGTGTATTTNMQFSNSGAVRVNGGTLAINTLGYKQTAGSTQLAGGSITAAKQMNINKGTLSGFGTITGSVLNGGTVAPSTTGGVLKITGAYNQTSAGTLSSAITGTTPGAKFGQLNVGGKATLAGTLKVSTGNGFVPGHGQSFSVLLYHTRSGMFGTLSGSPPYTVNYTATAANVVYP